MSLPQLIVDGSSGRRKVPMVKFLTPIYVYFYCFEILDKHLSSYPTPSPSRQCSNVVGTIQSTFTVSHSYMNSLRDVICDQPLNQGWLDF